MALAVAALAEKQVGRIILTRPAVEAGERLGFLPGDMLAKVDPYLRPLFDALYDMLDADKLTAHMERGVIEVAPLAFMRGRTLNDSFIILDEAQNTSPEQMQMFLTRLGFGSKVVVTGDVTQVDLPRDQASGLIQVRDILGSIDGIEFVEFTHQDVVRHKLVQRIVEAYKQHAEETGTARKPLMVAVEVENRSGAEVDEAAAVELARRVLAAEGIEDGELGLAFVGPDEMRGAQARPSRDRRGDRRPLVPDRRPGRAAGGDAARARRRRPLPAGRRRGLAGAARARAAAPARLRARRRDGGAGGGARVSASAGRRRSSSRSTTRSRGSSTSSARSGTCASTSSSRRSSSSPRSLSGVDKLELIALLLAIAFVLIAEMLNTAVEAAIDVATTSFDPMAKLAKDIAAGAVLIATAVAVAVGYLVFSGQVAERSSTLLDRLTDAPAAADAGRARADDDPRDRHEGAHRPRVAAPRRAAVRPRRGRLRGLDGGDADPRATRSHHFLISSLTFIMALLVAQTRVESGVHSSVEVAYGGLLGALVTLAVFQVAPVSDGARRQGGGGRREGVRAVLELPRRRRRAHDRRARVRGRQRRERRVSARRLRREERARRRGRRRLRPGLDRRDRDHRLAVRRLPPVAARVPDPRGQLPARRRLDRDLRGRASCCRTPGTSRTREVGLRRRRRPPERRQVDARERARRREDRDHLARCRTRRAGGSSASRTARTTSSCSSTCPASSGRWTS